MNNFNNPSSFVFSQGLAQGDISSMAYNMQEAFATTMVGLVIAAVGIITQ